MSQRRGRDFPPVVERVVRVAHGPLSWLWDRGFRILFALDALALYGAMVLFNLVRFGTDWPTYPTSHYVIGFAIATGIQLVVNYFGGLYEREPRLGTRPWLPRVALAVAFGTAIDGLVVLLTDRYLMPRGNLVALLLVGSVLLSANRHISRRLANLRQGPSRVLLVGDQEAVDLALAHFDEIDGKRDAVIVGTVHSAHELLGAVQQQEPTDVLLLDLAAFSSTFPEPLTTVDEAGIGIHQRVSAQETLLGLRSIHQIAGLPFTRVRTHLMSSHEVRLKRLLDLTMLVLFAPIALPVIALLALYVRIRAGSPVLYRQVRVGRHGTHFSMVKFRTMRPDAEAAGPQLASRNDQRVVPGLGWMRSTRADELPQLWNVLRGEMSLVGPRPERPELTAEIEQVVAGYARRNELAPGLTGLAQVQGRYDTHADYKLGYDLQYAVNWSIVLDLQIMLRTVWVVIARRV
ncbi:MAG: exopolysaccharide biosynthesis polyprenyl glycosylphosphotransferase [Ilumatobacteraceae bacterium]